MKSEIVNLAVHSSGRALLTNMLNVFGGKAEIAAQFGVTNKTVSNWFTPSGRGPGQSIANQMQYHLPGQEITVQVSGTRHDRPAGHDTYSPHITLNREDGIKYTQLLKEGKPEAARVFLLAEQHEGWDGVPSLAGASWQEDFDYDDFDYDDYPDADIDYKLE